MLQALLIKERIRPEISGRRASRFSMFPLLAVVGLLYLRYARPEVKGSYRVPCYPLVPLVYIAFTIAMMLAALLTWTKTSCCAIAVVLLGISVSMSGSGSPGKGIVPARRWPHHEGP